MLVAVASWAASFIWLKMALETVPPAGLAAIRFALASLVLIVIILPFPNIRRQVFIRGPWRKFLIIGLLGTFLPNILQNYGMLRLSAGVSGVVQGAGPIYTAVLAAVILREHFGSRKILGAATAFSGTLLLSLGLGEVGKASALGVGLVALSALSYSFYTIALKKVLLERMHPMALLTGTTICGTIPLLLFTLVMEPFEHLLTLDQSEIVLILILVFFPTVLAYACYVGALGRMEVSRVAAFIFLVPVGALLLGVIYLGESLSAAQVISSGLIIGGVIVAESKPKGGKVAKPRMNGSETLDKI